MLNYEEDEERKKRLEEARMLRNSVGMVTSNDMSVNQSGGYSFEQEKLEEAKKLRNSVGFTTTKDLEEDQPTELDNFYDFDIEEEPLNTVEETKPQKTTQKSNYFSAIADAAKAVTQAINSENEQSTPTQNQPFNFNETVHAIAETSKEYEKQYNELRKQKKEEREKLKAETDAFYESQMPKYDSIDSEQDKAKKEYEELYSSLTDEEKKQLKQLSTVQAPGQDQKLDPELQEKAKQLAELAEKIAPAKKEKDDEQKISENYNMKFAKSQIDGTEFNTLRAILESCYEAVIDENNPYEDQISDRDMYIQVRSTLKNKNIEKGGTDALFEYADTILTNAVEGGIEKPVAGLANLATTAAGLGLKAAEGVTRFFGAEDVANNIGDAYNSVIQAGTDIYKSTNVYSEITSRTENSFVRGSGVVTNVVSNVIGNEVLGYVTGVSGVAMQGMTVGGSSAQEVLNEDKDNIGKATIVGIAKGYTSYLTERLFDYNILTRNLKPSSISQKVNEAVLSRINSQWGKKIAYHTIGIIGENAEELIEDNVDNIIDNVILGKQTPAPFSDEWNESTGETAVVTTLSTIVLNLLGFGGTESEPNSIVRAAQRTIAENDMSIHYDPNQIKTADGMSQFYVSTFNEEGDLTKVTPTFGKEIKNVQPQLMISPVIVKDNNTNMYQVIDGATGVVLDSTYYQNLIEAESGYDAKVMNLSDQEINSINNTINRADYVIKNNIMNISTQIQDEAMEIDLENMVAKITKNNTTENAQNKNTDTLNNKATNYTTESVKNLTNQFKTQSEYTKNEMAEIWNNEIDKNNINVVYDKNGKIKSYIAIEEDGNNLKISQYDNNDNIVKTETIVPQNGKFTADSINNAIEKVTEVYKQNNVNKTPEQSRFYNNKENYAVSNVAEMEKTFSKKKTYTLDEVYETMQDVLDDTYDKTLDDEMYIDIEEKGGKLEVVLYDGRDNADDLIDTIPEINRVEIEKNQDGKYTAKAIKNAIEKAATMVDENRPIKGQVDIEGNEVRTMKKGRGNKNGRSTNNGQEINREQKGKDTSRENKNARSNELAKRKQSKGLQNYQEQQQGKLGKDFKATIVEESKQSNNEKTVSKGFKEATGLDVTVFNTNKNTTEAAFYSDDNIYLKHNSLANKKATNFKPYHEFGHWLKNNNYKAWKSLYDIIDNSITKQQIESYKNVLNDKSIFDNMTEAEERDYVINEIVSDYIGNWANDIMNWADFLPRLSKEYQQYLADITLENEVTGYNMFGTIEQQEQMDNQITEIMKDIIIDKKIEHSNDNILFSNRKDIDIGNYWQIEDSKDLFKGITSTKDLQDKAYKYILNGNTNYKTITDKVDGKNVKFARISAKEYVYGRNNKKLQGNQYQEKMRAAPSIDDLIKHADIKYHSPLTHKNKLFPNGYNNYQGKVGIDNDIFRYIVRIGKTKNNESIFYDVSLELLKQQKEADNKVLGTNNSSSQKSASINNSISQKKQNVKSSKDTVNNKSIHNNSKNTSTTKIKKSNRQDIDNINYNFPENVKDIKNTNTFLKKAIQNETDNYWSEQLKDALASNYMDWTRKESPLKWRRKIIQQYLDYKNGAKTDSNGNTLTKQQREYFKNSKAVDQYGNLKVVYHGTGEGTFTEFKGGTYGTNYYTDNIWSAKSYQVGTSPSNKVYEGYVNITNPLVIDAEKRNWSEIWRDDIKDTDVIKAIDDDFKNKYETYSTTDIAIAAKATGKYDGIIFNNIYDNSNSKKNELSTVYVTFNSNQFKNIDNKNPTKNPDIRYSNRYDTEGNMLTKEQQDFFKDSDARNDEGNLALVYHTTTDRVAQFNVFNPTTTKYYRFGDQVVNYFTDSQDMSGSYANSNYKVADTTKIENIDQAKKWIEKYNNLKNRGVYNYIYDVEKAENGMLKLIQYERRANGENQRIGSYTEVKYKDLIQYVQILDHNFSNIQYQGYLNITNPYIVDAKGKNWNKVQSNIDKKILSELTEIKKDKDTVVKLKNLQQESLDKYLDYISGYKSFYEDNIKGAIKDISRGQSKDLKEALEYCMMFGFNFDEYVESLGEKYNINGNTKIKDIYNEYLKNHNVNDIENYKTKMIHFADNTINKFLKKAHEYFTRDMMYGKEYSYFKENYAKILGKSYYDYSREKNITPENLYKISKDFFSENAILDILGENETTNDIVKKVLEMNRNGSNYDGIIMKNVIDYGGIPSKVGRSAANLYVTFNSNQFKAKDNLNPTNDSDIRYSNRYDTDENNNYGFYSQLENVIEQKMPNTSNAKQINGLLNNSGIKQDELKWIGLDDYLKAHSLEKISKEQLLDYIKANQINIETVEKGVSKLAEYTEPVKQDIADLNVDIQQILEKYGFDYEEDDLIPYKRNGVRAGTIGDFMAENLEKYIDLNDFEKYEKQEDGSYIHTYKDSDGITWTRQFTENDFKEDMQRLEDLYEQRTEAELQLSSLEDEYGDYADELGVPKYEKYSLEGGENYKELLYTLPAIEKIDNDKYEVKNNAIAGVSEYNSPHWEEKNVLAHARTKDFEDTSGNKVLYIDEIQSDMHQQGRKEGYANGKTKKELSDKINNIKDEKTILNEQMLKLEKKIKEKTLEDIANKQNELIKKREKYNVESELTEKEQYELLEFSTKMNQIYSTVIEKHNIFNVNSQQNLIDLLKSYEVYHLPESIKNKFKNKMDKLREFIIDTYKLDYLYNRGIDIKNNWATLREDEKVQALTSEEYKKLQKMQEQNEKLYYELEDLRDKYTAISHSIADIFPFKKNWHEFVLRRLINNAVEQGYDEVAWSTGRQQRERYNLSKVIDHIYYQKQYDSSKDIEAGNIADIEIRAYKDGNKVFDKDLNPNELENYIGKDLSMKILNSKENAGEIGNLDETVNENPNSGMYLFYDQEIPNFLNKYLKKWNSKVETITLKDADGKKESKQMGFKITDEMRNSIKQNGQPLFSNRNDLDDTSQEYVVQDNKQKERLDLANKIKSEGNTKFAKRTAKDENIRNAERGEAYIEQEIQKIEKTGNWDNSIPVTKLSDIRKIIEDYLGLGIKKGHFRQDAYAIYKGNNDVIRTKEYKDMDSILHETGHAIDLGKRLNIDKESIADELLTAIDKLGGYEGETRTIRLEEGFAEVIREYSIVPEQAKIDYPQTVAVLEGLRKTDKKFNDFITKVQQQSYNYIHQNPRNRTLSNVSIGEQTDKTKMTKNFIKQEVMRNIYDKDWAVKSAVNELAKANGKTVNQIKASENAYYLTRLAAGTTDRVISMLSDGYIAENGTKLFPGLNKLGDIIGKDTQRWNDLRAYLVAQRDLEYKAKTLKTGIRTMDSKAVVEQFKNDKQIQQASKLIYDTLNGVMQYAVDNGLVTQETADALKQSNAFYVPMQRVLENQGNKVGRRGAVADIIQKRTGSELDVKDVLENIVANSSNIIQQVENNNALKALYKEGQTAGLTGTIYDVIDTPMTKIGTAQLSTWESELQRQGVNTADLDLEKTIDLFAPNKKVDQQNLITSFIDDNGKRVYLQFNDDILFNSLMNMDKKFMSTVLKINSKLNMPLRYGATMANLGFAIPNMLSDTAQAAIYSTAGFIPVVDNALGVLDIMASTNNTVRNFVNKVAPDYANKINALYSLYQQSGATNATRLSQYRESTQNLMSDVYGTKSKSLGIKEKFKPLKRLLDVLTYIPEISEQSTRFEVFKKNYKYYKNKGTAEMDARILAALESRDATQDFSRTGNITREINQLIPFSAARVGSAYTFAEKVKANPKRVGLRIALLTAIALGIKALGYDDKEIEELNQRKKDDNFVMRIGDKVVTIKKPQGILRSMINLAEYIEDLSTGHIEEGKEGKRLERWLNNAIMDNMPADEVTGFVPNAVAPLIENAINKDFYYNTDIVKSYDLDLPDAEQYYDYNSQLAIWLGKIFNYSPAKIDNLISGYFGGLGTMTTNAMDYGLGKAGVIPEKPEMGAEQDAIGKRFVVNVNTNSSSIDEIYDRKTELTKKQNGGTITSVEENELAKIKAAISTMSNLNKQIKEIKQDLTMSGTTKAEKIRVLQQQKTDTARQALGKELINSSNNSKIQSSQFYPNDTLKKNGYSLTLNSTQKKEYEQIANEYYSKYEKQGLYSKAKLNEIKSKAKEYAKAQMFKKYRTSIVKTK